MYYFAYGSNLDKEQLKKRKAEDARIIGKATLDSHAIRFNKKSIDGSGKANVVQESTSEVEGVIFDFTEEHFKEMDKKEIGYHRQPITLQLQDRQVEAEIYFANPDRIDDALAPTKEYLDVIIKGAKAFGLSDTYQKMLATFSTR